MRWLVVVTALLTLAACGGNQSQARTLQDPSGAASPTTPSPTATGSPGQVGKKSCVEVREGIAAFNAGDFDATVEHFTQAVPLAEAEDDGSQLGELLVEAVKYYAHLAPADYPDAAASSPDFAKYKQVTLGLCDTGDQPPAPDGSSQPPGVRI